MAINQRACAKINLCLHLTGQRDDGYHLLDSLVVFADVGDHISVAPADEFALTIAGPFGAGLDADEDNLAAKAARIYPDHTVHITLEKNLPVASGIGGGSADAAAVLRAMADMTGTDLPTDLGLTLGADVPVCVHGSACRMQGIGEDISAIDTLPPLNAVLVWPDVAVSTGAVFQAIAHKDNEAMPKVPSQPLTFHQTIAFLKTTRNDMQNAAMQIAPAISDALDELQNSGVAFARMSGSGATCFGLYETADMAANAAQTIAQNHPNWWVQPTVLNNA